MFLTKEEYRILKYVQKHNHISKSELVREFPHLSNIVWKKHIDMFLEEVDDNRRIFEEKCKEIEEENVMRILSGLDQIPDPELSDNPNNVFYYLNFAGREKLESYNRDFWRFWVPWVITTLIAAASLYLQFK